MTLSVSVIRHIRFFEDSATSPCTAGFRQQFNMMVSITLMRLSLCVMSAEFNLSPLLAALF
jgi:hypothetical protein